MGTAAPKQSNNHQAITHNHHTLKQTLNLNLHSQSIFPTHLTNFLNEIYVFNIRKGTNLNTHGLNNLTNERIRKKTNEAPNPKTRRILALDPPNLPR